MGREHVRSNRHAWPSLRPVPPDSLSRAGSSESSRVHVPGSSTVRGCPAVTGGLDRELARLQDRGTGGLAPLATPRQRWTLRCCVRLGRHRVRCDPGRGCRRRVIRS